MTSTQANSAWYPEYIFKSNMNVHIVLWLNVSLYMETLSMETMQRFMLAALGLSFVMSVESDESLALKVHV